jgi:hypothetical protein
MNKKTPSSFLTFLATAHLVIKSILITTILLSTTQTYVIAKVNYGVQSVEANVLYVAAGGNCGVAVPCFSRIQDAIDTASIGDTIKVAQGVYFVSLITIREVIYISKPITLQGGYTITDWDNPLPETNITWIDAQQNRRGIYINSIDQGLIIINGLRIINGGNVFEGAGICINQGNVSVADSI